MSTLKQIEANRLNAQKSTGPRSVEGKSVSSMNALQTGIDAKSEIIRGEDPAALEALTAEYNQRFQPATPEERDLVDTAVASIWQLRRFRKVEAAIWEKQFLYFDKYNETDRTVGDAFCHNDTVFARLQRRVEVTDRIYNRTLDKLRALKQAPQATESIPDTPKLASFRQPPSGTDDRLSSSVDSSGTDDCLSSSVDLASFLKPPDPPQQDQDFSSTAKSD